MFCFSFLWEYWRQTQGLVHAGQALATETYPSLKHVVWPLSVTVCCISHRWGCVTFSSVMTLPGYVLVISRWLESLLGTHPRNWGHHDKSCGIYAACLPPPMCVCVSPTPCHLPVSPCFPLLSFPPPSVSCTMEIIKTPIEVS